MADRLAGKTALITGASAGTAVPPTIQGPD